MTTTTPARPLRRILGMGFGLALVFGTMVGVGILRLPGSVAAALGDRTLIVAAWALGGLYALMGAVAVAELAAMIPEMGDFRVYARRAFGEGIGFTVGWVDWLTGVAALAFAAVTTVLALTSAVVVVVILTGSFEQIIALSAVLGSIAFLIAAVAEDPRSGLIAAAFLACCAPVYARVARSRRLRAPELES